MAINIGSGISIGGGIGVGTGAGAALPPAPTTIGQSYGGGYYFGTIDYSGGSGTQKYYLVVAPKSTQTSLAWGLADSIPNSFVDGYSNTYGVANTSSYPAAQYARGLSTGGYTDWYIPSWYEMQMMIYNLKPYTVSNLTGGSLDGRTFGVNAYAVPSTSAYTSSVPGQVADTAFQTGGAQVLDGDALSSNQWWTSTQREGAYTMQNLIGLFTTIGGYGSFGSQFKTDAKNIRCIRRVTYY